MLEPALNALGHETEAAVDGAVPNCVGSEDSLAVRDLQRLFKGGKKTRWIERKD